MTELFQRLGALFPGVVGGLGFLALWGDDQARFWLAVPTSNFGMVLLPIAYIAFFFMINSPSLLGDAMPRGLLRVVCQCRNACCDYCCEYWRWLERMGERRLAWCGSLQPYLL